MVDGNISMSHQELQQAVADIRARKDELHQFLQQASRAVEQVTGRAYKTKTASQEFRNAHTEWNRATGDLVGSLDQVADGVEQTRRIDEQTDQKARGAVQNIRGNS